jgi:hypothetical protein
VTALAKGMLADEEIEVYFAWFCLFSLRLLGAEYALCGVLVSEW